MDIKLRVNYQVDRKLQIQNYNSVETIVPKLYIDVEKENKILSVLYYIHRKRFILRRFVVDKFNCKTTFE